MSKCSQHARHSIHCAEARPTIRITPKLPLQDLFWCGRASASVATVTSRLRCHTASMLPWQVSEGSGLRNVCSDLEMNAQTQPSPHKKEQADQSVNEETSNVTQRPLTSHAGLGSTKRFVGMLWRRQNMATYRPRRRQEGSYATRGSASI